MQKMKVILVAVLALVATSMKPSEEIKWMDFNAGYSLAKKKGKIMLVDVYTEWCGWCKRMDRDAYAKPEIAEIVGKDFIAIKFNPEVEGVTYTFEGKNYTGAQLAGVISNNQLSGYPTTIFINPKVKKTEIVVGYKNAEQLRPILEDLKVKLK